MMEQAKLLLKKEAYVAGLIDANGTIGVRFGRKQIQPYIVVRHKSLQYVKQLAEALQFGKPFYYGGRYYACQCFGVQKVYKVLEGCIEFLIFRKRVAKLVLKFCESRIKNLYEPLTLGELQLVQNIAREVKK